MLAVEFVLCIALCITLVTAGFAIVEPKSWLFPAIATFFAVVAVGCMVCTNSWLDESRTRIHKDSVTICHLKGGHEIKDVCINNQGEVVK